MEAVAHDPAFARRAGVPPSVGAEFVSADKRGFARGGRVGALGYADGGAINPLDQFDPSQLQYGDSGGTLSNGMHAVGVGDYSATEGGITGDTSAVGYSAFDPAHQSVGDTMYDYDKSGKLTGTHAIAPENGTAKDLLQALATVGGAYLGFNAAFGGVGGLAGDAASEVPSVFNPAADSQLASSQLGLTAADVTAGGIPSVSIPDLGLSMDAGAAGGAGASLLSGISPGNALKLVTAALNAAGGGSGSGSGGDSGSGGNGGYQSHEIDPGYTLTTPGWRTDRPLYVPGQDAIPEGWYGAGHKS